MAPDEVGVKVCPPSRPQREAALVFLPGITSEAPEGAEPEARGSRYIRPWPVREPVQRDKLADKAKRSAVLERLPAPDFAASWPESWRVALSVIGETCHRYGACDWSYDRLAKACGYGREAMIKAVKGLVSAGVLAKQVRAVDGEMNLTNRLTLQVDGPLFAAAVGWLRKWCRWLSGGPIHPSREQTDKYHPFLRRLRLWKDELSRAIGPGDLIAYADWYNPPQVKGLFDEKRLFLHGIDTLTEGKTWRLEKADPQICDESAKADCS